MSCVVPEDLKESERLAESKNPNQETDHSKSKKTTASESSIPFFQFKTQ